MAASLQARVLQTPEQALQLAFPGCTLEQRTLYLTAEQKSALKAQGFDSVPGLVTQYRVYRGEELVAFAYWDTHRVRTLPQTLLVILDPQGAVLRVELLAFAEPPDYLPREGWYRHVVGTSLQRPPVVGDTVPPVAGATLTAHATTAAVRRILALHQVVAR
ncbi:MAG: hypothetical protein N2447_00560 [Thermoanaerobaculum sp.]|nr:hypothetical protein [Thermoanaerobaculum sp.]